MRVFTMANVCNERITLVLQGGGALGAYQAGAFAALDAAGYCPDWLAGISIGAVNAAIICGNPPGRRVEQLEKFWKQISSGVLLEPLTGQTEMRRIFNEASAAIAMFGVPGFYSLRVPPQIFPVPQKTSQVSIYDTSELRETLTSLVDFDIINSGGMRLSVGAVNVRTGNFEYFDSSRQKIGPEHIMASGALPPGFPPIEIDGEYYWDGGLVSNTPLQYVLEWSGPRYDMCIFQIDLFSSHGLAPTTLLEVAEREKDIRYSSRTRMNTDFLDELQTVRRNIRHLAAKLPPELLQEPEWLALDAISCDAAITVVHLIHRRKIHGTQSMDYEFSRYSMEENWAAGRSDVEATLSHPSWINRIRPPSGVAIFDLTKDLETV
jgi:NTE family protein